MGSIRLPSEQPIHTVNVPSFEMMRTEVTVGIYRVCVNVGVCTTPNTETNYNWSSSAGSKKDHPMNGILWYQLSDFAQWVGVRLPTEA